MKNSLRIFVIIAVFVAVSFTFPEWVEAQTTVVITPDPNWGDTQHFLGGSDIIYELNGDIDLSQSTYQQAFLLYGTNIIFDGKGHSIIGSPTRTDEGWGLFEVKGGSNITIKNVNLYDGIDHFYVYNQNGLTIENVMMDGANRQHVIITIGAKDIMIKNCIIKDSKPDDPLPYPIYGIRSYQYGPQENLTIDNVQISHMDVGVSLDYGDGGGLLGRFTLINSTLTNNNYGLRIDNPSVLTPLEIYHNNFTQNAGYSVSCGGPNVIELSHSGQGNYWGHNCPNAFISRTDGINAIDSYPYGVEDGWNIIPVPAMPCNAIPTTFTLTVNATNGSVTKIPDQPSYTPGTQVQLTANPAQGYHFVSWSGDATGTNPTTTIMMDGNKSVIANFETNPQTAQTITSNIRGLNWRITNYNTGAVIPDMNGITGWHTAGQAAPYDLVYANYTFEFQSVGSFNFLVKNDKTIDEGQPNTNSVKGWNGVWDNTNKTLTVNGWAVPIQNNLHNEWQLQYHFPGVVAPDANGNTGWQQENSQASFTLAPTSYSIILRSSTLQSIGNYLFLVGYDGEVSNTATNNSFSVLNANWTSGTLTINGWSVAVKSNLGSEWKLDYYWAGGGSTG